MANVLLSAGRVRYRSGGCDENDERLLVEQIKVLCANEPEFDEKRSALVSNNFDIVIIMVL
jgi:hypothetical protein